MLVTFVATLVYSAMSFNMVYLLKPALEAAVQQDQQAAPAAQPEQAANAEGGHRTPEEPQRHHAPEPTAAGPGTAAVRQQGATLEQPGREAAPRVSTPLDRLEQEVKVWLRNLPFVRGLKEWFFPEANLLRIALALLLVVGPLLLISGFVRMYAEGVVVWSALTSVRFALFQKLSSMSLTYYSGIRTGELISRLTNDLQATLNALKIMFGKLITQPIMFVIFFAMALGASWQLTLIALVCFPAMVFTFGRYGQRIRRHGRKALERLADVTDSITQLLNGIRVVKSFNMEEAENEEFRRRNEAQLSRSLRLVRSRALADVLPDFFMLIPLAIVCLVAHYLLPTGKLKFSDLMLCIAGLGFMAAPVRRLVKAYNDLQQSLPGVLRTFELLDMEPYVQDAPDAYDLPGVHQGVEFRDVWFAYDQAPVLKGISLQVPCGKLYAIVGETGAGKSTMLDLIPRFYDPTEGAVLIDGHDVRRLTRKSLMQQIAIVGQHPFLFNRSLAQNICYGKPGASFEEVVAAARAANIHEFIESLPHGYDTLAGEAGGRLSGGQRQCITIARAILKNAPILILDEATSSLDAESEMLVQQGLNNLMEGRTTFVIAHRLSTVRHADRIVVLRDGRIVEEGTHEDLLSLDGEYGRLYQLQFIQSDQPGGAS